MVLIIAGMEVYTSKVKDFSLLKVLFQFSINTPLMYWDSKLLMFIGWFKFSAFFTFGWFKFWNLKAFFCVYDSMDTGGRLIAGSHNKNEFILINADEISRVGTQKASSFWLSFSIFVLRKAWKDVSFRNALLICRWLQFKN